MPLRSAGWSAVVLGLVAFGAGCSSAAPPPEPTPAPAPAVDEPAPTPDPKDRGGHRVVAQLNESACWNCQWSNNGNLLTFYTDSRSDPCDSNGLPECVCAVFGPSPCY